MSDKKHIDWTLVIVAVIMCAAFGVVEVIEANEVSTDEFRRWFGSIGAGLAALGAYKWFKS